MPEGIPALRLPPYSPELNPVGHLWHSLRGHHLSNSANDDYTYLLAVSTETYRVLTPPILCGVCACPYLERAEQS